MSAIGREPLDLDEAQRLCQAAGSSLEVEYDTCDCDHPCDHKPFAVAIKARHGTVRLELSDFVPTPWIEAIAKAPAMLGQVVAELRECRTQRDENLANVPRIDDRRIAETARLQRELDDARAEVDQLKEQVGNWHAYLRWRAGQDSAAEETGEGA